MKRSNGELKGMARQMLLGRYQIPMLAMILGTLIPSMILLPFSYLCSDRNTIPMQAVLYYLASFIVTLIELLLNCGVKRIHLGIARGQQVQISDMFWVLKNRPDRILIGGFLITLITWIPMIPVYAFELTAPETLSTAIYVIISELLSMAGLIIGFLITLPLYFVFWIYAEDPDIDTRDAFRRSISLTRGAKWRLVVMELSFIGWMLLSALTLGIGLLWIMPYMEQSFTNFYLEQKQEFDVTVEFSEAAQEFM